MKLFGTDGVRGKFGYEPITPQTVLKLGWAIGTVFREQMAALGEIIIGKDTRVSGYVMESALTSGLLSSGVNIALLGPVPYSCCILLLQVYRRYGWNRHQRISQSSSR